MAKRGDERMPDLFDARDLYPVHERVAAPLGDFSLRMKTALGTALKECPESAAIVALRMSESLNADITTDALYACTAPSKPEHQISLIRFVAFVRATGAYWLYDLLLEDEGFTVVEGEQAYLVQLGHLEHERQQIDGRIRELKRDLKGKPVDVQRRRPRGRA